MLIAILAFLFVTGLFGCLGICIAAEVKGRQKIWTWLLVLLSWAAIVAYATNLAGLWGKTFDASTPIPDWIMVPFCVLFFTLPVTIPLMMTIGEIWRKGGQDSQVNTRFFEMDETMICALYVVAAGVTFLISDSLRINHWWFFLISLVLLLVLILFIFSLIGGACWLTTQLARRFSPAAKRTKKLENE